jgi:hypothetical protein
VRSVRRILLWLRWPCTTALLLTILAWIASLFWWVTIGIDRQVSISVATGAIHFGAAGDLFDLFVPNGVSAGARSYWMGPTGRFYESREMRWWLRKTAWDAMGCEVCVPLWMPALAFAIPTRILWASHLRRRSPSVCGTCGYDCSGLPPASLCPECGQKA